VCGGRAGQTIAQRKGKDRAVLAHHEHVAVIDLRGGALDQIEMSAREGIAVDDRGGVAPGPHQGRALRQVGLQAGTVLQQRDLSGRGQDPEVDLGERRGVLRPG